MAQRFPCSARFALYRSLEVTRVLRLGEPPGHEYRREVSDKEHDRSVVQERSTAEAWRRARGKREHTEQYACCDQALRQAQQSRMGPAQPRWPAIGGGGL